MREIAPHFLLLHLRISYLPRSIITGSFLGAERGLIWREVFAIGEVSIVDPESTATVDRESSDVCKIIQNRRVFR